MKYQWSLQPKDTHLFLDRPVVIDASMQANLDGFAGRDPGKTWAWFVFATRLVTEHDIALMTGASS